AVYPRSTGFPRPEPPPRGAEKHNAQIHQTRHIHLEVKGGKAAETASDTQIAAWMEQAAIEAGNADVPYCFLVTKRAGKGPKNAGDWWVHANISDLILLNYWDFPALRDYPTVRLRLADLLRLARDPDPQPALRMVA
ncbi:MAG: hypothetical protein FWG25_01135, partial [Promicromonosporaceae bacterium]|nr:hypothetical protein [Promicromonosporaceae bacterium]